MLSLDMVPRDHNLAKVRETSPACGVHDASPDLMVRIEVTYSDLRSRAALNNHVEVVIIESCTG